MLSVDGDADAAVTTRTRSGWFKFRSLTSSPLPKMFLVIVERFIMHVYAVVHFTEVRCGE